MAVAPEGGRDRGRVEHAKEAKPARASPALVLRAAHRPRGCTEERARRTASGVSTAQSASLPFAAPPPPTPVDMDLRQRVQDSLSGTHTIERELGGGGMSRVFVANEHRLGRKVVVKVLAPDLAAA